ncbi:hypothetical protein COT77_02980 [Candidatus Berkelbacteria bacterium CG10_big_fil_rev_8_21_14_0_10_41_12]|uniref:Phosphatidic acid phosphatase type 2/haloperoxidase domain-containing protein n=1 Tax=Candidatus Berkelbacteria bacterium CG10_big_fil_rev_8_21_14_0_10_41_12 TaxID=1974513 RepID=A0A2M6WWI2_9BACT|nr:MAG: hypothetical protein COT77_02980 [Candidatus Berkelbacteria bacterium CG10_big_fil_rev_8_21_14_0_10_41_12]
MKKMDIRKRQDWAEILSLISSPPLVSTVFFIFLVFKYSSDLSEGLRWLVGISPFLIFIPITYLGISYKLGWVSDFDISERNQRPLPMTIFIIGVAVASIILYFLKVPLDLFVYALSGFVTLIIMTVITFFWKISLHTATLSSIFTAIVVLGGLKFLPFYLILIPVGWSRVVLKKHSVNQVIAGVLVSSLVTLTVFHLFGYNFNF